MAMAATTTHGLFLSLSFCLAATSPPSAAFTTIPRYYTRSRHTLRTFCASNMAKKSGGSEEGVMMILSPAKTLDLTPFSSPVGSESFPRSSTPSCDAEKTRVVASAMKARSRTELEKLLAISANLATKSKEYWDDFDTPGSIKKPAIYAFSGAAYQGLDVSTCSVSAVRYLQQNLRIIDPLYGALRPLDLIQPYRLEMASRKVLDATAMSGSKDLAKYWKPAVTSSISEDLRKRKDKILINVASDEYSSAVDASSLPDGSRYIKIVFQQEGRVISVHAKKARGFMVRYIAENNIQDVEGIRHFDTEGYKLVESKSTDDTIVFDRPKQAAVAAKKKKAPASKEKAAGPKTKKRARSKK